MGALSNQVAERQVAPVVALCYCCFMSKESEARVIYLDWLKGVVQPSVNTGLTTLWHYTNAGGLTGILESDRLWATDTVFLNDSAELRYGRDLVLGTIQRAAIGNLSQSAETFILGLLDPSNGILGPWLERSLRLFVTCFCSEPDVLSQWRYYGGQGDAGGYAIGFTPPGPLPAWGQAAPQYLTLRKVVYDETEQRTLAEALVSPLVNYLELEPTDPHRQAGFAAELVNGIAELASWCKHPAFAEEQEWRLTYTNLGSEQPLPLIHRPSGGFVVPRVELQVPRGVGVLHDVLPITHIQCGPSQDAERKIHGVRSYLAELARYGDVDVSASASPARI